MGVRKEKWDGWVIFQLSEQGATWFSMCPVCLHTESFTLQGNEQSFIRLWIFACMDVYNVNRLTQFGLKSFIEIVVPLCHRLIIELD